MEHTRVSGMIQGGHESIPVKILLALILIRTNRYKEIQSDSFYTNKRYEPTISTLQP